MVVQNSTWGAPRIHGEPRSLRLSVSIQLLRSLGDGQRTGQDFCAFSVLHGAFYGKLPSDADTRIGEFRVSGQVQKLRLMKDAPLGRAGRGILNLIVGEADTLNG
jgi:hypothetical protein